MRPGGVGFTLARDADGLQSLVERLAPPGSWPLVARRRQIVAMMLAERQRQRRLAGPRLPASLARRLAALQTELTSLEQAGKPKLVAPVATARKLLTIPNTILRDNQPWTPQPHRP